MRCRGCLIGFLMLAASPVLADASADSLLATAYRHLWHDDAPTAARLLRRYVADQPAGEAREERRHLALAESWSGDQRAAIVAYRALLAEDARDHDARVGLGRALVWDHRPRAGFAELRLAERASGSRAGSDVLLRMLDEYDTPLEIRAESSRDSDAFAITRLGARARATAGGMLAELATTRTWYRQDGRPSIAGSRFAGGLVTDLGPRAVVHAYGWVDRFDGGSATATWTQPGGDAWLTWLPTGRLRLDLGGASLPLETMGALDARRHVETASASVGWQPRRRMIADLAVGRGWVSDGNRRWRAKLALAWRRDGRVEFAAGPEVTAIDHARAYPGDYWAPDGVINASGRVSVGWRGERWVVRGGGSFGLERETGGPSVAVGAAAAHLGVRLAPGWLLAGDLGFSRSRLSSDNGYRRTHGALGLRGFF